MNIIVRFFGDYRVEFEKEAVMPLITPTEVFQVINSLGCPDYIFHMEYIAKKELSIQVANSHTAGKLIFELERLEEEKFEELIAETEAL